MKNIFQLAKENFNFVEDVLQLKDVFEKEFLVALMSDFNILGDINYDMSFENYIDKHCFRSWKYKETSLNIASYKKKIKVNFIDEKSNPELLCIYLEYVYNMVNIFDKQCYYDKPSLIAITDTIEDLLSKVNLKIRKIDEQKYIVVEDKKGIDKALENTNEKIGILLVQYLDVKNTLEEKKNILVELANYFEGEKATFLKDCPKIISDIYNDNQYYFNNYNIRHNNISGKHLQSKVKAMSPKELEKIYDGIYNNCIILISSIDNKDFIINTNQLKKDIPAK